jgi:N-acetylglucosamine-6-sulfatase
MPGSAIHRGGRSKRGVVAAVPSLLAAVAIGSLAAGTAPDRAPAQGAERPNVVVIMTDDQAAEQVRVMDQLLGTIGGRGTTFMSSFVNWPVCCPSRVTFLTGQYAHNHGVLGNRPPLGGFQAFDDSTSLATWLEDAGYRTALVGKYLNGYGGDDPTYVPPGWSEWYAGTGGSTQRVYDYTINENGNLVEYGIRPQDFKQDVLTRYALDFLRRQAPRPRPFFLFVSYTASHSGGPNPNPNPPSDCQGVAKPAPRHANAFDDEPLPRPPSFDEADVLDKPAEIQSLPRLTSERVAEIEREYRCQLESLLSVDDGVGRIVETLSRRRELDNTYLFFTADNGYFHGEHRIPRSKGRVYEEAIRVPLLVRGPGFPRGVRRTVSVINADLAPTIAGVTGTKPGLRMDGRSLLRLAQKPGLGRGRELLIENIPREYTAIRTPRFLYALHQTEEEELYDLRVDPYQLHSRHGAPAFAQLKARLAARLAELRECAGPSCR